MKAVWFEKFGEARDVLQYGDIETQEPGKDEVRVRLHASCVNPSDVKKRAGAAPGLLDNGLVIPNSDGAGIIEAVGDSVPKLVVGQRVWVYNGQYGRRFGTSAEYITLSYRQVVPLPDQASFEVGACMGIPAMTAHRCLITDESVKGKIVLVTGGSGRVGYYAIQWAKLFGATVIATAGSSNSVEQCEDAGADFVIGHPSERGNEKILAFTAGEKVDLVVEGDFGVNLSAVLKVLKTSGTIATYSSMTIAEPSLPFRQMLFMDLTLRIVLVYAMPDAAKELAISDITQALKSNSLKHRIVETHPLIDSAAAHEAIEKGNNYGCVVITM